MNIALSKITHPSDGKSAYIPLPLRRKVLKRDKNICHFCKKPTDKLCHDIPKCLGGKTIFDNLLPCCRDCSRQKQELTAAQFWDALKLKEENIFEETTSMFIKVYYISGRTREGEVETEPTLKAKTFYMKVGDNGKMVKVNIANVEDIEILGGREKK